MKSILLKLLPIAIAALPAISGAAQTSTITYTATSRIDRFDEYAYFIGATSVASHEYNSGTGAGTVIYNGSVSEIGDSALYRTTTLTSIVVPEGVSIIGKAAFMSCTHLTTVSLPVTLTQVKTSAFNNCNYLSRGKFIVKDIAAWCAITFDGTYSNPLVYAKHIYADENTEITQLIVPQGVTTIGDYAFYQCEGLTGVQLPSSLTSIGESAFAYCKGLEAVNVPTGVTSIGERAFYRCYALKSASIPEGVTAIGYMGFSYTGLTSVALPSTIRDMNQSFTYCDDLAQVTLTEGITTLGHSFSYLPAITTVHIPSTVKMQNDFTYCSNLETVTIAEGVTDVDGFSHCEKLSSIKIPSSATEISGFASCTSLKSINIPQAITKIFAFKNCTALEKVIIEDLEAWCQIDFSNDVNYNPQYYAQHLYLGDEEITKLVIPQHITKLKRFVFNNLTNINTVTIHSGITSIHGDAFLNCTGVDHVFCSADPLTLSWNGKGFKPDKATLFHVSDVETWKSKFPDANVTFVSGMTTINYTATERVDKFDNFTLFTGATDVSAHNFDTATGQGEVTYVGVVRAFDDEALKGCATLTGIIIPEGVTSLGTRALGNCSGLTTVVLPSSLATLAAGTFEGSVGVSDVYCTALPDVFTWNGNESAQQFKPSRGTLFHVTDVAAWQERFPNANVTFIGGMSVFTYTATEKVTQFEAVNKFVGANTLVSHVFNSETGEGTVIYDGEVTELKIRCFYGSKLTSIILPSSITTFDYSVFNQCTELTMVSLPKFLKAIPENTFRNCAKLERVYLGETINSKLGQSAFSGCTSLKELCVATVRPFPIMGTAYDDTFTGVDVSTCVLRVPRWQKEVYQNAPVWCEFLLVEEWEPEWWPLRGDVNIDWAVNGSDVTALYNLLLNGSGTSKNADVNRDGNINGTDVTALYNLLLK